MSRRIWCRFEHIGRYSGWCVYYPTWCCNSEGYHLTFVKSWPEALDLIRAKVRQASGLLAAEVWESEGGATR